MGTSCSKIQEYSNRRDSNRDEIFVIKAIIGTKHMNISMNKKNQRKILSQLDDFNNISKNQLDQLVPFKENWTDQTPGRSFEKFNGQIIAFLKRCIKDEIKKTSSKE